MSYRFATAAQWRACLFDRVDRDVRADAALRSFGAYAQPPQFHPSRGAFAPAITRTGELFWRDDAGSLYRLAACEDAAVEIPAPFAIAQAMCIVATPSGLWAATNRSLERYEEETLARLLVVEIDGIADIAADGGDGIYALTRRDGGWQAVHVDRVGRIAGAIALEGIRNPRALAYLSLPRRFVVLDAHQQRLLWFDERGGKPSFMTTVAAFRPCFVPCVLGSDWRSRIFVGGADGASFGGAPFILRFDADGNHLGDVPLDRHDAPVTGIAAHRDTLLATGPRGLLRFGAAETVPDDAGEARFTVITPVLHSPDREDARRWRRVEASAILREGATLVIAYAATDDTDVRDRLTTIAADESQSASRRVQTLLSEPGLWHPPTVFHGGGDEPQTFAAPLFDVREPFLWVAITLTASPGARLPELSELSVLYPGLSLMENLPAIYRRAEAQSGSFLRALVGVVETTTQGLDARIASLGSRIHPATASGEWLDFLARWLGLPWDDGLDDERKRAILRHAPKLAAGRGTRAGLEALLESLMPGLPRRFRVTDATADFGFAILGGDGCEGTKLPAMLGAAARSAVLDLRVVLGATCLPYPGQRDDAAEGLTGTIRVEVAANAEERRTWEPWLLALIEDMVPVTARVELRWVSAYALRGDRLDGSLTLDAPPAPHLGTDSVTGLARLPERAARLSRPGAAIGTPLG